MKIIINESYSNILVVGEFFSHPVLADGAGFSTPFEDRYKWVNKEDGIACHNGRVVGLDIYLDKNGKSEHIHLDIAQISSIAMFWNNTHGVDLDPDYVDPADVD